MISTTEIKNEIQLILRDYKHTMTKDLEQALENLHDDIESDKYNFVDLVFEYEPILQDLQKK